MPQKIQPSTNHSPCNSPTDSGVEPIIKSYQDDLEQKVRDRTLALEKSRQDVIHCLARAAEYRDNETGRHAIRVAGYAGIIARQLGMDDETVQRLEQAAKLHDVGKIAIPDSILLKPGKLTEEEFEIMQQRCSHGKKIFEQISTVEQSTLLSHTTVGASMISGCDAPVLDMASTIALTHHERWDGTGYPLGLAGEDIPIEGRITSVADVFDALSTKRPYKPAFPREKCLKFPPIDTCTHSPGDKACSAATAAGSLMTTADSSI